MYYYESQAFPLTGFLPEPFSLLQLPSVKLENWNSRIFLQSGKVFLLLGRWWKAPRQPWRKHTDWLHRQRTTDAVSGQDALPGDSHLTYKHILFEGSLICSNSYVYRCCAWCSSPQEPQSPPPLLYCFLTGLEREFEVTLLVSWSVQWFAAVVLHCVMYLMCWQMTSSSWFILEYSIGNIDVCWIIQSCFPYCRSRLLLFVSNYFSECFLDVVL